ncbi:MAG: hypothetical protein O3B03_00490 [Proteobacteria bacterium]|nr:hypothetical protein [Pseudomonadota bacterium]
MMGFSSAFSAEVVLVLSSEAIVSSNLGGEQNARADFDFGAIKAWLREDGHWQIEGDVMHRSGFCGTYQLGIQFGTGNPGCANVKWLTGPIYVTKRLQCNGAGAFHSGGNFSFPAKESFNDINCAQSAIKCNGKCN